MPFPNIDPLIETFFEPTRIWLFGKPFESIKYDRGTMNDEFIDYTAPGQDADLQMPPRRIERTLRRQTSANGAVIDPIFARI